MASENDPLKPEFPVDDPKFPATPTYQIDITGFSNVWLKDESHNPTGTHKDRMGWEIIVTYHDFLLAKKSAKNNDPLPGMSIISSDPQRLPFRLNSENTSCQTLKFWLTLLSPILIWPT